jgi:hypothetical protein
MPWLVACAFLLIVAAMAAVQFRARLRMLDAHTQASACDVDTDRYRPMMRLLSDEDTSSGGDAASRAERRRKHDLFREYLRSLTEDYGRLLAGIRSIMTQSGMDRPDLAEALVRNRLLFAAAVWRIELRLGLYQLGIGGFDALKPDVLGLVNALDVLRGQCSLLAESAAWGS